MGTVQKFAEKYIEELERTFELIRQKIFDIHPNRVESLLNVYKRTLTTKKIIKDYLTETKLRSEQKVVLVSHYTFLGMYTTKWSGDVDSVTESDFEKQITLQKDQGVIIYFHLLQIDCIDFKNCKFIQDPNEYQLS